MKGADPWVVKKDGFYYFCESRNGGIFVSKSRELTKPKDWKRVWSQPDEGWNQANLWAPELHWFAGRWYIYYTAGKSGPPFVNQRAGVLSSTSKDPQGSYTDEGQLYTGDHIKAHKNNIWAIDLTVLTANNQLYAIWSGWKLNRDTDDTPQYLYIAKMKNPWTISSNRRLLSSPDKWWETDGLLDINEGPEVLKHKDQIYIIYSTRESWLKFYRLGQLKLKHVGANPIVAQNWVKSGPVFRGTNRVYGVGNVSFTTSPDGSEHWFLYHSKVDTAPGWDRNIRAQRFGWHQDGSPDFGTPVAAGKRLAAPSGQCR